MTNPRPASFILAATDNGTLIVPRFDYAHSPDGLGYGVGFSLLGDSQFQAPADENIRLLLTLRRDKHGQGVVAIDCGANIGAFSVSWARHMSGWGWVMAIEAQERLFYALAGNLALNNCLNAQALHAAVGAEPGRMMMPQPDYTRAGSFGSLELRAGPDNEPIGQPVDYAKTVPVRVVSLDALAPHRVDLIKIDVEGMEFEVLCGARDVLTRFKPILLIEAHKGDVAAVRDVLHRHGYTELLPLGLDWIAIHPTDPAREAVTVSELR
jgi:FkbM family methyltransferase